MSPSSDVLIVDDDVDMAEVVREVLQSEGYSCRVAANGREALALVSEAMPALVLLDMLMPVMSGWECAQQLREQYGRGLPIILLTAAEHAESRGESAHADAVLAKPFELDALLRIVDRYVPRPGRDVRPNA
jgi:CheY-like chemotaxis protein